jgi:hypothetical protein
MSKQLIEIDGKRYEFPVVEGSENEEAIDIKKLRDLTGIITLTQGIQVLVPVKLLLRWRIRFCVTEDIPLKIWLIKRIF